MISLVQVTCPHCGAQGQVLLPPQGMIVVGPCPQCQELVAVFCGKAFALDKDTMLHGSAEEKSEHLMGLLCEFVEDRIDDLLGRGHDDSEAESDTPMVEPFTSPRAHRGTAGAISETEFEEFLRRDLPHLDDANYFRAIFG